MTLRFLSIGECMIELAPQSDGRYGLGYAGDTFNTAWYARRLAGPDIEVAYLTAIGDDAPSQGLAAFIQAAGIRPEITVRPGRTIGLYLITLTGGERSFSYWRSTSAARTLADDLTDLPGIAAGDMAMFSGITLAILPDDGRRTLLDALARARAHGARIAFDPNIRPRLWSDTDTLRRWVMAGAAVSDIVLPSFEDEAIGFGDATPSQTADRYGRAGAAMIVVKNGPDPVLIRNGDTVEMITPAPAPSVVDTTAAGDSFNARFLIGLLRGEHPADAAQAACDLAGRVIGMRGALAPV
jgi:2-dehydro-3-deoxygluconokinase